MAAYPTAPVSRQSRFSPTGGGFRIRQIGEKVYADNVENSEQWYDCTIIHAFCTLAQKNAIETGWTTYGSGTIQTLTYQGNAYDLRMVGRPTVNDEGNGWWTVIVRAVGPRQ